MLESETTIEQEIAQLEKQLQEKKAALEYERSDKDVLREVIGEKMQQHIPSYLPSQPQQQSIPLVTTEPPSYLTQALKDKIQEIIKLVFDKNLEEGIKEAGRQNNPALLDAFHDILTDELYDQLVEKRKIDRVE